MKLFVCEENEKYANAVFIFRKMGISTCLNINNEFRIFYGLEMNIFSKKKKLYTGRNISLNKINYNVYESINVKDLI